MNPLVLLSIAWLLSLVFPIPALGSDERDLSASLRAEAGVLEGSGAGPSLYQSSSLLLRSYKDLDPSFSWDLAGEAHWQASGKGMAPEWELYPVENGLDLETENLSTSDGKESLSLRLSRASLKWSSGPLDLTAGLFHPDWGSGAVYRPTEFFFPARPLLWEPGLPLGSEGMDAKWFLFDDLSVEAAGRLLQGGAGDWVLRLVDKSVAYTVVPSFARVGGGSRFGLELQVLFPDGKVWAEGSLGWDGPLAGRPLGQRCEALLGASTLLEGTTLRVEYLKDGMGSALGPVSEGPIAADYFFASAEKGFPGEWAGQLALARSADGGPWIVWPKARWGFSEDWEAVLQFRLPLGGDAGPLGSLPFRGGAALTLSL